MKNKFILVALIISLNHSASFAQEKIGKMFSLAENQAKVMMKEIENIIQNNPVKGPSNNVKPELVSPRTLNPDGSLMLVPSRD